MKKKLQHLLLFVTFLLPIAISAQNTLTVNDGTATNEFIPLYGYWADNETRSQSIIPAFDLSPMVGGSINGMTFYSQAESKTYGNGEWKVYLSEISDTILTSLVDWTSMTEVYDGILYIQNNEMVITFSSPYIYQGGNLLVGIYQTVSGSYDSGHSNWYGVSAPSGSSYGGYGTTNAERDFLPKITFNYTPGSQTCPMVNNFRYSNLSPNAIDLAWTAGGTETMWEIAINPSVDGISRITSYDTTYTLSNLTDNTTYRVSCRAICGSEDSSLAMPMNFTTPCLPIFATDLPYVEDFESYGSESTDPINTCWYRGTTASTIYPYPSATSISGDRSLYFYGYYPSSGTNLIYSYAVLPAVDPSLGVRSLQLNFDAMRTSFTGSSYQSSIIVGVMTDPTDFSTFDTIEIIDLTSEAASSIRSIEVPFNCYSGSGSYIALYCPVPTLNGSLYAYNYIYVDNISLDLLPSCARPYNLVASDIQPYQITLSWHSGGSETDWLFSDGTNEIIVHDTFYTVTQLQPSSFYSYSVRSYCGGETSSATSIEVRTSCGELTELPFFEDFEHQPVGTSSITSEFIPCWVHINNGVNYAGYPYVSSNSSYNHTEGGTQGLYWYGSTTTTGAYGDYYAIVLPPVDTTVIPTNRLKIRFWAKTTKASYHPVLYVGIMGNPDSMTTFQPMDSLTINGTAWLEYESSLANFSGYGANIAIVGYRPSSKWYACVDDITLEELPPCPYVENVAYDETEDGVEFTWTEMGEATSWQIVASTSSDTALINEQDIITVNDTSYTFTNLANGTTYYIFILPTCSEEMKWSEPIAVTPGAINMQSSGSQSITGCGIVVFDNGGIDGTYSNSCNSYMTVYPDSEDSIIGFYGSYSTESPSYDWLVVYEGVDNTGNILFDQRSIGFNSGTIDTITSITGPITIWFRSDAGTNASGFEIHTFCLAAPNCSDVTDITIQTSPNSALVSWNTGNIGEYTGAIVEYRELDNSEWDALPSTTETNVSITGLTPSTTYEVRVKSNCAEGEGGWMMSQFNTGSYGCAVMDSTTLIEKILGNDNYSNDCFPSNSTYNYSLTQQIYRASEFDATALGGEITKIGFELGSMNVNRLWNIYVSTTTQNNLISGFIPVTSSNLVWSGNTSEFTGNAWNEITLSSPINFDGSNILVTIQDVTGTWSGGNHGIISQTNMEGISRYIYQDATSFNPANTITSGTSTTDRLNMSFYGGTCLQEQTCAAPIVHSESNTENTITLSWAPGNTESSWNIYSRAATDSIYAFAGSTTNDNYILDYLQPSSHYYYKVVPICDSVEGDAAEGDCWTLCGAIYLPFEENFENEVLGRFSRPCWVSNTTNLGTFSPYPMVCRLSGETNKLCRFYNGAYLVLPEFDAPLNSLQARFKLTQIEDSVRLMIGLLDSIDAPISSITPIDTLIRSEIEQNSNSVIVTIPFNVLPDTAHGHIVFYDAWNDDYSYIDDLNIEYIPNCTSVTEITVNNVTPNSANIEWVNDGSFATSYIVEYGPHHFTLGSGTQISITIPSITLTELTSGTTYDIYIYAVCQASGDTSFASNVTVFSTECAPISLPYTENFDNILEPGASNSTKLLPNCWNYAMTSADGYSGSNYYPTAYHSTNASSGEYCLRLYGESLTVLPEMPISVDSLKISFHKYSSSDEYLLVIGAVDSISQGFEASFVALDTIPASTSEVSLFLTNYSGSGHYIAFKNINAYGNGYSYIYIDDIIVDQVPSCIFPMNFHTVNATSTTADISWNTSNANDYEYEYGITGFIRGTGLTGTCTGRNASLSGLTASSTYDIYVRGICSVDDTSDWNMYTFRTRNSDPTPVPYSCDFSDNSLVNSGFDFVNNATNAWVVGAATGNTANSLYISNNGGSDNVYNNTIVTMSYAYRDLILDAGEYIYSYDWKAYGESSWDYLRVWLAPCTDQFIADQLPDGSTSVSNYVSTTPASWISLDGGSKLNLNNNWTNREDVCQVVDSGVYHLVFMWCNDDGTGTIPPAAIDNISIRPNTCPTPINIHASAMGISSIEVDWTDIADAENWQLSYGVGTNDLIVDVTSHPVLLNGLDSLTNYNVKVRAICSDADTGRWSEIVVLGTTICDNASAISNGTPTASSNIAPVDNYFNFTLSETIIDSEELNGPQSLSAISYYYNYTVASSSKNNVDIYLQPTTKSVFTDNNDIVALNTDIAIKVYSGNLNCTQGWNLFVFDTVYEYDGIGNLLVIVDDNSNNFNGSSYEFGTVSCSGNKTIAYFDDNNNPDVLNPGAFSGANKNVYTWRPAMRLISCGASCIAPEITSTNTTYNSANFSWTSNASDFEICYKPANDIDFSTPIEVTTNNYTILGLTPATQYTFKVRALCDTENISDWCSFNFVTDSLPCFVPESLHETTVSYTSVTLEWANGGEEQNWVVKVFNSRIGEILDTVSSHPTIINGLTSNEQYYATVQAACGSNFDGFSDWSDTILFNTATCTPVSNVQASAIDNSTDVEISWEAGDADTWQIEYGLQGFGQGEGTLIDANTNQFTVTGLEEQTAYDFYVRSVCSDGIYSTWSNAISVITNEPSADCGTVMGVEASVDQSTVTISWNDVENATDYELEYGVQGFVQGNGTIVEITNATSHTLTLEDGNYSVLVRAICGETNYGPWSDATEFTISTIGISSTENSSKINIYPNPTSGATTISVIGVVGKVNIDIVDLNGKVIQSSQISTPNSQLKVENLAQGAYFVLIYGDDFNSIRKLIVR